MNLTSRHFLCQKITKVGKNIFGDFNRSIWMNSSIQSIGITCKFSMARSIKQNIKKLFEEFRSFDKYAKFGIPCITQRTKFGQQVEVQQIWAKELLPCPFEPKPESHVLPLLIHIKEKPWIPELLQNIRTVSYTHLTLPTNREV